MKDTVEAIVAEMRLAQHEYAGHHSSGTFRRLADRLQSAHDAEREALRDCRELNHKMVQRRCQQDDELERAESRLREAERDARRLDAVLANGWRVGRFGGNYRVEGSDCVLSDWCDSPRAAIDRAMEGKDG